MTARLWRVLATMLLMVGLVAVGAVPASAVPTPPVPAPTSPSEAVGEGGPTATPTDDGSGWTETAPATPTEDGSGWTDKDESELAPAESGSLLPDLATMCRAAPDPETPGRSALDVIDFGPSAQTGSIYSTYRYAGWRSHLYNPGCGDDIIKFLAERAGGVATQAQWIGEAMTQDGGPNRTTNILITTTLVVISATVAGTRIAYGQYPLWDSLSAFTSGPMSAAGTAVIAGFITVGMILTIIWLALWRRRDTYQELASTIGRALLVIVIAGGTLTWNATAGPAADDFMAGSHQQASVVATGDQSVDAGTAVGDALIGQVFMPLWGAAHLGWDRDAIETYTERLHAASAFTVGEAARVEGDSAAREALVEAKKADYDKVAAEIASTHPAAAAHLDGKDAAGRILFVVMGLFAVLSAGVLLLSAAVVVVGTRVVVRVAFGVYPVLAFVLLAPPLQRWGIGIPLLVVKALVTGVAVTVVSVVYTRVVLVEVLTGGEGSVFARMGALVLLNVALLLAWKFRHKIATKVGVAGPMDAAARALQRAADKLSDVTEQPRVEAVERFNRFRGADGSGPDGGGDTPRAAVPSGPVDSHPLAESTASGAAFENAPKVSRVWPEPTPRSSKVWPTEAETPAPAVGRAEPRTPTAATASEGEPARKVWPRSGTATKFPDPRVRAVAAVTGKGSKSK